MYLCQPLHGAGSSALLAVKRLEAGVGEAAQGYREFHKELQVLGTSSHPNILPLIGFSAVDEEMCLVFPLMSGGSLEDRLVRDTDAMRRLRLVSGGDIPGALSSRQRVDILVGVARAVIYLHTPNARSHKKETIHRDIKPGNILLDANVHPRLADAGMARDIAGAGASHMTTTHIAGTNGYVDPHVLQSGRYDQKSDGYAFGITMLRTVTGFSAFDPSAGSVVDRCSGTDLELAAANWPADEHDSLRDLITTGLARPCQDAS